MNINRHNYEEYFILYWDNELSAEEKQMVDEFVYINSDLHEEFRIYGETRFIPDNNIKLKEKELLLNDDLSFINKSNFEETLLFYVDDELTLNQKTKVDKFVSVHADVKKDLELLQRVKLTPDQEIVFPDKSVLYRRDEKVRVIKMTWLRVAVAAAVILVAGLVTIRLISTGKNNKPDEIVKTSDPVNQQPDKAPANEQQSLANTEKTIPSVTPVEKKLEKQKTETPEENLIASNNEGNKNNLPKERPRTEQELIAQNSSEENATDPLISKKPMNDAVAITGQEKRNDLFDQTNVTDKTTPTYTIYNPDESAGDNNDKGGLKTFLRKATRVIERRTNVKTTTDDNKLLVGMFAVSLK